jgi:hypothetical protein
MVTNAPVPSGWIALVSIHQYLLKRALEVGYSILSLFMECRREIPLAAVRTQVLLGDRD